MADTLNSHQMGRKHNNRRHKSTASVGERRNQRSASQSSSPANLPKFIPQVDGQNAFIHCISRLGKHGQEFTWHDLRKVYHKETSRTLTVEEMNAIYGTKNLTKRDILELEPVKQVLESIDTMLCRFRLNMEFINAPHTRMHHEDFNLADLAPVTVSELEQTFKDEAPIVVSTDVDDKSTGPTSDLSKSDVLSPTTHGELSHQASLQSTDDEGWVSGRETRSDNSSPPLEEVENSPPKSEENEQDEFFEKQENTTRIAAGSDEIDGGVVSVAPMIDNFQKETDEKYRPTVVTTSIEAAFDAINENSFGYASSTIEQKTTVSTLSSIPSPAPRKAKNDHEQEPERRENIQKLIEKFDTPVKFVEVTPESPKSIYSQVLEEIGEAGQKIEQIFSSPTKKKQLGEDEKEEMRRESPKVLFRNTSTYSQILKQEEHDLTNFANEQEKREAEFSVKEQASMSSLDREYFESKMNMDTSLFEELGDNNCDGFTPRASVDPLAGLNGLLKAEQSLSDESAIVSEGLVTVIERVVPNEEKTPKAAVDRKRQASTESDADVPYSLCSEDEGEPMTMIERSMKATSSGSSQSTDENLDETRKKKAAKTVVVNVELDANNQQNKNLEVNTSLKERIAALQAAVAGQKSPAPIAKTDSIDEDGNVADVVHTLNRTQEFETSILEIRPPVDATNSDGSMRARRRQVRFMRGCCVVS